MAKRAPVDEKPYRPVDEALLRAVMVPAPVGRGGASEAPVKEPPESSPQTPQEPLDVPEEARPLAQVLQLPQPAAPAVVKAPKPIPSLETIDRRDREKRVLLTPAEEIDLEGFVTQFAQEIGTALKLSHVLRACKEVLLHAKDEVLERAKQNGPVTRPSNGNPHELNEFEHAIARIIWGGIRDSSTMR